MAGIQQTRGLGLWNRTSVFPRVAPAGFLRGRRVVHLEAYGERILEETEKLLDDRSAHEAMDNVANLKAPDGKPPELWPLSHTCWEQSREPLGLSLHAIGIS